MEGSLGRLKFFDKIVLNDMYLCEQIGLPIFTGRQRCCLQVMFTPHRDPLAFPVQGPHNPGTAKLDLFKLDLTVQGSSPRHVKTCSLGRKYGWQVGSLHPTGMLSCYILIS